MDNARTTQQAAEWLLELQRRDVTEKQISAWQAWLNADAQHKRAFDRLQTVQDCIDAAPSLPWPTDAELLPRRSPLRYLATAAAVVLTVIIGFSGYRMLRPAHGLIVETSVGELRRVQLVDGSTVTLGGHSQIAVDMKAATREIALSQGEAFFEVAKDARRPFTVHAGNTSITAVGTAFDVRRAGLRTTVAVSEGVVEIHGPQGVSRLTAGQQVQLGPRQISPATALAPSAVGAWREGHRQYLAEPLADVVADLSRYSTRQIVIDDAGVGQLAITGAVFERDIDRWLHSLETALPVAVRTDSNGAIHVAARH